MTGASFDGLLYADSLQVGDILLMRSDSQNNASFKDVVLRSAKIAGQIDMSDASFDGLLDADSLQVGGDKRCQLRPLGHHDLRACGAIWI